MPALAGWKGQNSADPIHGEFHTYRYDAERDADATTYTTKETSLERAMRLRRELLSALEECDMMTGRGTSLREIDAQVRLSLPLSPLLCFKRKVSVEGGQEYNCVNVCQGSQLNTVGAAASVCNATKFYVRSKVWAAAMVQFCISLSAYHAAQHVSPFHPWFHLRHSG